MSAAAYCSIEQPARATVRRPWQQRKPIQNLPGVRQPRLTVYQSITEIATALQNNTTKAPIGIFLLVEQKAPELHLALKKAGLLQSGKVRLLVAGVTPKLVDTLEPKPILIDLLFSEIIETAVERLIQRILNYPNQSTTSLIAPRLIKSS